jgi:hypothetical protein
VEHQRVLGLDPSCFIVCHHPGCKKKAQLSKEGVRRQFCNAHMRDVGLTPRLGASGRCAVEGCAKAAQTSVEGGRHCIAHARELGLADNSARCARRVWLHCPIGRCALALLHAPPVH